MIRSQTRGYDAIAKVIRIATDLQFLDLSDCALGSKGAKEIVSALGEHTNARLETVLLENDDFSEVHYDALKDTIANRLPCLQTLSLALNEDLEDNDAVASIAELLESQGGRLLLDDDTEDDLERNYLEEQREVEFVKHPVVPAVKAEDADVSELADLIPSTLKIKSDKPIE